MHQKVEGKAKFKTGKFKTFHVLAVSLWVTQISINKIIGLSFSKFVLNFSLSFSVLWTTSSDYLQSYVREEAHRGFEATVEEQGLSGPSRHLRDVFNIWEPLWWPCVLEAKYRWERANLQTSDTMLPGGAEHVHYSARCMTCLRALAGSQITQKEAWVHNVVLFTELAGRVQKRCKTISSLTVF